MTEELAAKLRTLADKYEVASFCDEDPSQFLRWYNPAAGRGTIADVEAASFIAAMLAFGNRKQFIPKIREILQTSDRSLGNLSKWLCAGAYKKEFPSGEKKFYRFYSYDDMQIFFGELAGILEKSGSLGEYFRAMGLRSIAARRLAKNSPLDCFYPASQGRSLGSEQRSASAGEGFPLLYEIVSSSFPKSAIVPKGRSSANKRVHMYLRWMVRQNSPVDLGLWQWANPAELLIPLDVHVMQEAAKLGLIPETASASRKTAELLTSALNEVFPGDPCRGDFALFGLGVDK